MAETDRPRNRSFKLSEGHRFILVPDDKPLESVGTYIFQGTRAVRPDILTRKHAICRSKCEFLSSQ
jgi:hypothetical protein